MPLEKACRLLWLMEERACHLLGEADAARAVDAPRHDRLHQRPQVLVLCGSAVIVSNLAQPW